MKRIIVVLLVFAFLLLVSLEASETEQVDASETSTVEEEETIDLDDDEKTKEDASSPSEEEEGATTTTPKEEVKEETVSSEESTTTQQEEKSETSQETTTTTTTKETQQEEKATQDETTSQQSVVSQSNPFVDLLGPNLYALEMVDEKHAKILAHNTTDALDGKKVVGLYFSADWCGPCRQFTPELVSFYENINSKKRWKDAFEIVWVSRCRDVESYGQYFTHMKWLALPPEEAMGRRGEMLSQRYKVQGIPTLILLDGESAKVITKNGRAQVPQDKAGVGFPWRNPLSTLYMTLLPKTLRNMIQSQWRNVQTQIRTQLQTLLRMALPKQQPKQQQPTPA